MMHRTLLACSIVVALVAAADLVGADADDLKLQTVISQAADRFEKGFAERDAKTLSMLFTEQGEYVDADGTVFHGRASIEAEYAASFSVDPPGKISISMTSIRPVADGVVIEEGVSNFTPDNDGPKSQMRYTATHVRQKDGSWLLASVRELQADREMPHERLKDLAWLIGDWREEVDGTSISTKWQWSKDQNFLTSEFVVRQSRDKSWQGTHRIGWDAERKQLRSWIFESAGGFGEGHWTAEDDGAWAVSLTTVNTAGIRSASSMRYEPDGKDAIVVSLTQRNRAGSNQPDLRHRIVRSPPVPESAQPSKPVRQ